MYISHINFIDCIIVNTLIYMMEMLTLTEHQELDSSRKMLPVLPRIQSTKIAKLVPSHPDTNTIHLSIPGRSKRQF